MSKKTFYITTAIDYVNGKPHIGHAVEKIFADVFARAHRAREEDVFFLTGTDENSLKSVQAAEKADRPVDEFVAENAESYRALWPLLALSFDDFIRTTEPRHIMGAQKFWESLDLEDIYKKQYRGFYCIGCEEFKTEKDLVDGKCPDHLTVPETVEEENYFFKLSRYENQLKSLITDGILKISPDYRKNEVIQFIEGGLEDFSISRSVARAKNWGVPVPGDSSQVMYVWVDALSNYITALGYADRGERYQKYWEGKGEKLHVIGKGILRFHAIYWPAMLLSAKLPLPTSIYVHEYLTINNQKISKTLGNVIDPVEVVERFGTDAARYLLTSALPSGHDGDISWEKMEEKYTADLANGLGNLVARLAALGEKAGPIQIHSATPQIPIPEYNAAIDQFRLSELLQMIWREIAHMDKEINEVKLWEKEGNELKAALVPLGIRIISLAKALEPLMPNTAKKIHAQFRIKGDELHISKTTPLFPRV